MMESVTLCPGMGPFVGMLQLEILAFEVIYTSEENRLTELLWGSHNNVYYVWQLDGHCLILM